MPQIEARVEEEWYFWRPITEKILSHTEASEMYMEDLMEVNIAIDRYIKLSKNK